MCPTIVKKQMDEQYKEIMKLKSELKTANLKLKMKKNELEKEIKITNQVELIRFKDEIELAFRQKLEEEKLKNIKRRVEEINLLKEENFSLKKQLEGKDKK